MQTVPGSLKGLLQQKGLALCCDGCEGKDDSKGGVRDVYDIPALAALELLSFNIECLEKATTSGDHPVDTPGQDDVPRAELHASSPTVAVAVNDGGSHDAVQLSVLSKKFLSKNVPPILLRDYLLRLHKYCPMSTAVYLATSLYFTKMVAMDRLFPVTPKNKHRLVLAGLQVAMKALEDLSYPHSRVAKVGGVSQRELSRIEISFCFLVDFKLRVDAGMLLDETNAVIQKWMDCKKAGCEVTI